MAAALRRGFVTAFVESCHNSRRIGKRPLKTIHMIQIDSSDSFGAIELVKYVTWTEQLGTHNGNSIDCRRDVILHVALSRPRCTNAEVHRIGSPLLTCLPHFLDLSKIDVLQLPVCDSKSNELGQSYYIVPILCAYYSCLAGYEPTTSADKFLPHHI